MKYKLGQNIKYHRERNKLSQKQFAGLIGVSNSRVSNWEQGINRPDADILVEICIALKVSADSLLGISLNESESIYRIVNPNEFEFVSGYRKLDVTHQEYAIAALKGYVTAYEKQNKSGIENNLDEQEKLVY